MNNEDATAFKKYEPTCTPNQHLFRFMQLYKIYFISIYDYIFWYLSTIWLNSQTVYYNNSTWHFNFMHYIVFKIKIVLLKQHSSLYINICTCNTYSNINMLKCVSLFAKLFCWFVWNFKLNHSSSDICIVNCHLIFIYGNFMHEDLELGHIVTVYTKKNMKKTPNKAKKCTWYLSGSLYPRG